MTGRHLGVDVGFEPDLIGAAEFANGGYAQGGGFAKSRDLTD
jgi:hypothetical protein